MLKNIHFHIYGLYDLTFNIAYNKYLRDIEINIFKIVHILCVVYDTVFVNTKVNMCPVIQLLLASTLGIKDIKLLKINYKFY